MKTDILIVGSGVAGLFCALHLPNDKKITIITKRSLDKSDSFLAQGGICVLRDENDYDSYFEDTMKAGHYENNKKSVDIMISSSREVINDLVSFGVNFQKKNGEFLYTKEGAHSRERILFHEDETGKEITSKLLSCAQARDNITILDHTTMVDIIEENNTCYGAICHDNDGEYFSIYADYTMLATGGIGGLFKHSTNFSHLRGDALAIALKHNIKLKNIDYIQIHPTTFYTTKPESRSFLISESVRGEGAILLNSKGERFVNELLPRDVVTNAIYEEMKKEGSSHVWLSMERIPKDEIRKHFPHICQHCLDEGYDPTKEPIPVVPAQHYFMGGIDVDENSKTSMHRLYSAGEASCNGVHGKNRLASNSLLESLVFAKRSAQHISANYEKTNDIKEISIDKEKYKNYKEEYAILVKEAIEREKSKNE